MIKIKNLNKFYNKGKANQIHVIDDTSLELPSKGLITFLGHSGSGKTTLLNVIGGLDKFNKGSISYDDNEFNKYSMGKIDKFRSRNIGYVFQNYNLLLEETVYDNLRIALDLIGVTDLEEQKKRIEYSLKAVGMFKYRKKVASFLSGGQQQRVSIARALVKKSKVIIADEPTGNLDSKNTMDVMNILKKISKQSLVLLVTHETDVANFYSDLIYEVKDGKIIGSKEVSSDVTFNSNADESTIYLKDLKETKLETELGEISIHSDTEEPLKINLEVIVNNGNIYLKSDKPIKLLEHANVKVLNENYKELKREDIEDSDYDTSWYNDTKDDSRKIKRFVKRFKNSFISFRAVGRKQRFIYLCLSFIGVIMAVNFSFLSFALTVDESAIPYSKNIDTAVRYTKFDGQGSYRKSVMSVFEDAYSEKEIKDIYPITDVSLAYTERLVHSYAISEQFNTVSLVPNLDYNLTIAKGEKASKENEVTVSYDIADTIAKKTDRKIDEVIGLEITIRQYFYGNDGYKYTISGISKDDNKMIYLSPIGYENYFFKINYDRYYSYNVIVDGNYYYSDFELRCKNFETYELAEGEDLDAYSNGYQVLVSTDSRYSIGNEVKLYSTNGNEGIVAQVVGKFKANDLIDSSAVILNKNVYYYGTRNGTFVMNDSKNVTIVEGDYPKAYDEVIVSSYYGENVEVGSTIFVDSLARNVKVVGKFNSQSLNTFILFDLSNYALSDYSINQGGFSFKVVKDEEFKQRLLDNNITMLSLEKYRKDAAVNERTDAIKSFAAIFSVTAFATAIFVYFVMRSKMMSDIYNIGVYRSLGASRLRINNKYLTDIFILTTFTCLIGYILGVIGYALVGTTINPVFITMGSAKLIVFNPGITVLGFIVLYAIMYIFGMLPIIMLERKTPSEIIAKYDI